MQHAPNIFEQWVHVTFFFFKMAQSLVLDGIRTFYLRGSVHPFKDILPVLAHPGGDLPIVAP